MTNVVHRADRSRNRYPKPCCASVGLNAHRGSLGSITPIRTALSAASSRSLSFCGGDPGFLPNSCQPVIRKLRNIALLLVLGYKYALDLSFYSRRDSRQGSETRPEPLGLKLSERLAGSLEPFTASHGPFLGLYRPVKSTARSGSD